MQTDAGYFMTGQWESAFRDTFVAFRSKQRAKRPVFAAEPAAAEKPRYAGNRIGILATSFGLSQIVSTRKHKRLVASGQGESKW